MYAQYHACEVETKLNPAVAGCVLLFQKGIYSLLQLPRIIISLSETSSRRERGGGGEGGGMSTSGGQLIEKRCGTSHGAGAGACNDFHNICCAIITFLP